MSLSSTTTRAPRPIALSTGLDEGKGEPSKPAAATSSIDDKLSKIIKTVTIAEVHTDDDNDAEDEEEDEFSFSQDDVVSQISETDLEHHRYLTKEDEAAFNERDYATKIKLIVSSLSNEMKAKIQEKRRTMPPMSEEEQQLARDAAEHGVDVELLRDLKIAFGNPSASTSLASRDDGPQGVNEAEFMRLFGNTICQGMSNEQIRIWFRQIDQDCTGTITWPEISSYLIQYKSSTKKAKNYFVDYTIEGQGPSTAKQKHREPILYIEYSKSLDVFYTAAHDGMVHCWYPNTLRPLPKPIHQTGARVAGISLLPHNNRLLVLQGDRSIFVYDCFRNNKAEICHELFRAFATEHKSVKMFGEMPYYDHAHVARDKRGQRKVQDISITFQLTPVTLLESSSDGILCIDHLGGAAMGEPIAVGLESGNVEIYNLLVGSAKPLKAQARYKVHDSWITAIKYAPELAGVITSSLDEKICVFDLEKGAIIHVLALEKRRKPIFGFSYTKFHNILVTCGGRYVHVWNALTGAKLASLHEHEAPVVKVTLNVAKQHAYALMENKTIKVWDLRSWRPLGTAEDTLPRYPTNSLSTVMWCEEHHMLLTGVSELFAFRPLDVQEKLDAGVNPTHVSYVGHLHPVDQLHVTVSSGHITAIDTQTILIWSATEKTVLGSWKWVAEDDHITCSAFDEDGIRLLVGTEKGNIAWYNYACGFQMYKLRHSEGAVPVVSALVIPAAGDDTPPIAMAACGSAVLSWCADKVNSFDLPAPTSIYRPDDPEDAVISVVYADQERQVIAASYSSAMIVLLTIGLAPLHIVDTGVPADTIVRLHDSFFCGLHSDGTVRVFGIRSKGYDVDMIVQWMASLNAEDEVTALVTTGDKFIVSDAAGCISVFKSKRLASVEYLHLHVMPSIARDEDKLVSAIRDELTLVRCFKAHTSAITSLGIYKSELLSCSGDRHIRSWSLVDLSLICDFGVATPDFKAYDATKFHAFHSTRAVTGTEAKTMEKKLTRALTFTRLMRKVDPEKLEEMSRPMGVIKMFSSSQFEVPGSGGLRATKSQQLGDCLNLSSKGSSKEPTPRTPAKLPPIALQQQASFSGEMVLPPAAAIPAIARKKQQQAGGEVVVASTTPPLAAAATSKLRLPLSHLPLRKSGHGPPPPCLKPLSDVEKFILTTSKIVKLKPTLIRTIPVEHTAMGQLMEVARIREAKQEVEVEPAHTFEQVKLYDLDSVLFKALMDKMN